MKRDLRVPRTLAPVAAALLLVATACGGQAGPASPAPSSPPPASAAASKPTAASAPATASAPAKPAAPASAAAKPGAKKHVVIGLAVTPPNVVHVVPYVALDNGYFADEGLDVEIKNFEGGTQALRGSVAGGVDLAWSDAPSTIVGTVRGAGSKIIMGPAPKNDFTLVAQSGINSVQDLKGKKIGLAGEVGGIIDILNKATLQKAGIDVKDVTIVPTTTAGRVQALLEKKTDTAIVHADQALVLQQKEPSIKTLSNLWELLPDFYYSVLAAEQKVYEADPKTYEAIVRASIKAGRFVVANKDKTVAIAAKYTKEDPAIVAKTYDQEAAGKVWSVNGGLSQKDVDGTSDLLVQLGNLKPAEKQPYDKLVDPRFVEAALTTLGKQGADL
ncbi:MAG: ABC transporter substrate-binding protein [Chloroflexota bacterium]